MIAGSQSGAFLHGGGEDVMNKKKGGRRGKYQQWLTNEGLIKLEGWARDGHTDEQIAKNIGIGARTLYEWKEKFPQISQSLKRGKEIVDREVENALLKRALGYEFTEKKYVSAEMSEEEYHLHQQLAVNRYKLEHPEATLEELRAVELGVSRYKMVLVEEKTKEVSPDVTAQIFWLKNRKPGHWRDKKETELSGSIDVRQQFEKLTDEELAKLASGYYVEE